MGRDQDRDQTAIGQVPAEQRIVCVECTRDPCPRPRQDPGLDKARGFQERQQEVLGQGVPGRRGRPGESRGTDPVPQGLRHEDHATGTQDPNRLPAEPQEIGKMPHDTKTPDLVDRAIGEW